VFLEETVSGVGWTENLAYKSCVGSRAPVHGSTQQTLGLGCETCWWNQVPWTTGTQPGTSVHTSSSSVAATALAVSNTGSCIYSVLAMVQQHLSIKPTVKVKQARNTRLSIKWFLFNSPNFNSPNAIPNPNPNPIIGIRRIEIRRIERTPIK